MEGLLSSLLFSSSMWERGRERERLPLGNEGWPVTNAVQARENFPLALSLGRGKSLASASRKKITHYKEIRKIPTVQWTSAMVEKESLAIIMCTHS